MSENLTPYGATLYTGIWTGIILIILLVILKETISWYFNLGWSSETSVPLVAMAWVGNIAVNLYILYHRIALPTWLTFGSAVEFGGVISNVCTGTNAQLDFAGDGGWACFPSTLEAWLADVVGPEGWKYLLQPPAKLVLCFLFLAFNTGMLALLVAILRDPGFLFEAQQRQEERRQGKRRKGFAETRLSEQLDIKKE